MASVGGVYLNFGLLAVSLIPACLVVCKIVVSKDEDGEIENKGSTVLRRSILEPRYRHERSCIFG